MGCILTIVFISAAPSFVGAFVPGEIKEISVEYIRISSGSLLASTIENAVSIGTRTLDHPE
jgi:Na+-driven multidrug efflux pump